MNTVVLSQLILKSESIRAVDTFVSIFANVNSRVLQEIIALRVASLAELTFIWPDNLKNKD